ncbi:MAG: DUF4974 domain-containing protein [Flavobacteriaceae bacterium]
MRESTIKKYFLGEATEEEMKTIFEWVDASEKNKEQFLQYKKVWALSVESTEDYLLARQEIQRKIGAAKSKKQISLILKYAAVFLIGISVAAFLLMNNKEVEVPQSEIVLELSDGTKKVIYNDVDQDIVSKDGLVLGKQQKNRLTYQDSEDMLESEELVYNTLHVPFGKRFQLVLSDGSSIRLNSGTKIRYPIRFIKGMSREVFLDGEAYFKVSEDREHAFVVWANDFSTRVYGTEFNVSSYKNDDIHEVVLVKGSVGVRKIDAQSNGVAEELFLRPNEKASFDITGHIQKQTVNVDSHIVWMNGVLLFSNERLENIIRKLERHYDVSIKNNYTVINDNRYTGTFDIETIEEILKSFSKHRPFTYIIDENKIIINP